MLSTYCTLSLKRGLFCLLNTLKMCWWLAPDADWFWTCFPLSKTVHYCPCCHHNKSMILLQRLVVLTGKPRRDTLAPYREQTTVDMCHPPCFSPLSDVWMYLQYTDNFMFHYVKHETAICQEIWNLLTNVNLLCRLRCIWLLQLNRKLVILYENPIMSSYMGSTCRRINIVISIYISSPNGSNGLINGFEMKWHICERIWFIFWVHLVISPWCIHGNTKSMANIAGHR